MFDGSKIYIAIFVIICVAGSCYFQKHMYNKRIGNKKSNSQYSNNQRSRKMKERENTFKRCQQLEKQLASMTKEINFKNIANHSSMSKFADLKEELERLKKRS